MNLKDVGECYNKRKNNRSDKNEPTDIQRLRVQLPQEENKKRRIP